MTTLPTEILADAYITIVIDPFTAPWVDPSIERPTFTVSNFLPQSFIALPPHPRIQITQPGSKDGQYVPGGITVSGIGPLTICFKVISGSGTAAVRYTETGLIFGLVTVNGVLQFSHKKTGRDNFPDFISSEAGVTVTNDAAFAGSYEFVVVFQNAAGGVAVVDPRITNTADTL